MRLASRKLWLAGIISLAILGLALYLRVRLARSAQFPGHGDYAFYYTVAYNIASGRWLQVDYIWHYLNGLPPLPHYSSDFWMPLTSILTSLPMLVLGKSLFVALLPPIFAGLALTIPTFALGKAYSGSSACALIAAGLILFLPVVFKYSLLTDSAIFYTFFAASSLFLMVKGQQKPRLFLPAAALVGLAHLTRQDGILLFATLGVVIALSPLAWKTKLVYLSLAAGVYLLVLSPLLVTNLREFSALFPPGSSKSMFLTTYEDFYAYGKELSLSHYLTQGLNVILKFKLDTAIYNLGVIIASLGWPLTLLALAGILTPVVVPAQRKSWRLALPPVVGLAAVFSFYTLIATYSSYGTGFRRSLMAFTPFAAVVAVDFVYRHVRWKPLAAAGFAALAMLFCAEAYQSTRALLIEHAKLGQELAPLREILLEDAAERGLPSDEIVLMARDVWEVYETCRVKVVEIPNNDLDTILSVAEHYRANYVLLPARREALDPLCDGNLSDSHFTLVAQLPDSDLKVFRIR